MDKVLENIGLDFSKVDSQMEKKTKTGNTVLDPRKLMCLRT